MIIRNYLKNMMFCTVEYSCVSFSFDSKPCKTLLKDELKRSFCTVCEWFDVINPNNISTFHKRQKQHVTKWKHFFSAAELNLKNEGTNILPVWFIADKFSFICALFLKEMQMLLLMLYYWCENLLTSDYRKNISFLFYRLFNLPKRCFINWLNLKGRGVAALKKMESHSVLNIFV